MVHLPGKGTGSRRVPLLLTPDVIRAMDILVASRSACGIPSTNIHFFATPTAHGFLNGWQVMRKVAVESGIEKPHLIQSTRMRKYMATVTQVT